MGRRRSRERKALFSGRPSLARKSSAFFIARRNPIIKSRKRKSRELAGVVDVTLFIHRDSFVYYHTSFFEPLKRTEDIASLTRIPEVEQYQGYVQVDRQVSYRLGVA